ncbi:LysE family translocator [Dactylosporangium siamense]|uniref:Threonine transporter RhtB n=1 Tax=Dactylosporangium siamense TaxID=685454 RepID=A0A919PPS5_9ACTN|nr:LysE family translocator [Dactylosporangium siamense]GIG48481.1 threonine transporter RhtB [Dactylosporangium siamense]
MPTPAVAGFVVAILPLIVMPGASLTLLTHRVARDGARRAVPVILGTVTGLYLHATLAAAGLSALVMRSSELFTAVRLGGAAYLIGLGIWTWRSRPPAALASASLQSAGPPQPAYQQALLGNVLNPKAAAIVLTLVPQFIDPHAAVVPQIFVLATAQATLITIWLLGWTVLIGRARPPSFPVVQRVAGAVLVALGVRAAVA